MDMSQNHSQTSWRDDPRLKSMDPQKLLFLDEYAARVRSLPQNKKLPFLISLRKEAMSRGIQFDDQETLLLISVLSANLSPEQKKSVELFQKIRGL